MCLLFDSILYDLNRKYQFLQYFSLHLIPLHQSVQLSVHMKGRWGVLKPDSKTAPVSSRFLSALLIEWHFGHKCIGSKRAILYGCLWPETSRTEIWCNFKSARKSPKTVRFRELVGRDASEDKQNLNRKSLEISLSQDK